METVKEMMLDENQHRLLMCCRISKALNMGDIYLDATCPKIRWRIERGERPHLHFSSIDKMEEYLERLLENHSVASGNSSNMDPDVRRRSQILLARRKARTIGGEMVFPSRING